MKRSIAILLAATFAAYALAPWSGFIWDDHKAIERGRLISSLANVPRLYVNDTMFNSDGGAFASTATVDTYRPLTMTTLFVDRAIYGLHPAGFHITNILLHLACVLLTWAIARAIGVRDRLALAAALIFAVHPAISEGVHWINGRSDPLCVALFLAAVSMWLRGNGVACALLFFAATLSKETAFVLAPAVLTLSSRRRHQQSLPRAVAPWLVGGAAGLAMRLLALHRTALAASGAHVGYALERLPLLWLDGLVSLVLPTAQMPASLLERYQHIGAARMTVALLTLAILAALVIVSFRRRVQAPAWFLLSFLGALAPIGLLAGDEGWYGWGRYLYPTAPMFAVAIAEVSQALAPHLRPSARRLVPIAFAAAIVVCAAETLLAARDWRNDRAFATAMLADHPDSSTGWSELAIVELADHHPERAVELASRAVEIAPRNSRAWSRLATGLMETQRRADAYQAADRALALDPGDVNAKYIGAIRLLGQKQEVAAADLLVEVLSKQPEQQGPWQTLEQAARHLGPSSGFVREALRLCSVPRYAPIAPRIRAALPD